MKLSGVIKMMCDPTKSGTTKPKQDFVITLDGGGNYPDELVVSAFGDEKITMIQNLTVGQHVDILVDTRANEYNGRYYNSVYFYRFNTQQQPAAPAPAQPSAPAPAPQSEQPSYDDVPF